MAPTPPVGARQEDELNAYLKDLFHRRDTHERQRLLYVAATRARHTLWLSAAPSSDPQGQVKPDKRSPLSQLWPVLGERFVIETLRTVAAGTPHLNLPLRRLKGSWQPPAAPPALNIAHLPAAHLSAEPPEFSWVGETQRHIGTLVHAWLARLAQQRTLPTPAEIEAQRAAVLAHLKRAGVPPREEGRAAELVLSALTQTLADERGRWLLSGAHREAYSELALTGVSEGRLRNIIIDRSFIDEGGTRWVIDFKTSRHEGGGLEAFLDEEVERYRAQLATYQGLARALGPQPVRAALYFPLLQAFREL